MGRTTLTVGLPIFGRFFAQGEMHRVLELARMADDAGVDGVVVPDHVVMSDRTDRYTWGKFPFPIEDPWLEPLSVLAAMAAVTSRVRLKTGIVIAPLRPAALLAKIAATLDVLSQGRLELGVGTGWQKEEFDAMQLDYEQRGQLLTDTIAACRALWGPSPASFESPTMRFENIWCEPKPVQKGGIPIWFSGTLHGRNLDRMTRLGDGWIPIMGETPEGIAEGAERIRKAWTSSGRDPARLKVQGTLGAVRGDDRRPDLGRTLEAAQDLLDHGATDLHFGVQGFVRDIGEAPAFFRDLGRRWQALRPSLS